MSYRRVSWFEYERMTLPSLVRLRRRLQTHPVIDGLNFGYFSPAPKWWLGQTGPYFMLPGDKKRRPMWSVRHAQAAARRHGKVAA